MSDHGVTAVASRFVGRLSPQGIKALPFLRSAVTRGLSANQTLETLRVAGMGYRRTSFLSDFAMLRGDEQRHDRLRFVRKDRRPDVARLAPARTRTLRRYAFVAELRGADPVTGEGVSRYVTLSTDRVTTVGEMESVAEQVGTDRSRYLPMDLSEVVLRSAVSAGERGTIL